MKTFAFQKSIGSRVFFVGFFGLFLVVEPTYAMHNSKQKTNRIRTDWQNVFSNSSVYLFKDKRSIYTWFKNVAVHFNAPSQCYTVQFTENQLVHAYQILRLDLLQFSRYSSSPLEKKKTHNRLGYYNSFPERLMASSRYTQHLPEHLHFPLINI